ncbi:MAG: sulfatase-like hydrolase/transferase [Chloroflexota bacterium]
MKIILMMTDTQRKDMVGCYGNQEMQTPHLDRLAHEGMRFEKAYTCTPVCGPARAAMFTGLFPHSNGAWGNSMPLGDQVKTIGQRLQNEGIHTAYVGKWHLDGSDYFGTGQCPDGWDADYWYDMRCYLEELSPEERLRSRQPRTNDDPITADFTFGHRCSNRAIDFLSKHGDEDFLLIVSYDEPHHPFLCPPPYNTIFADYLFPNKANLHDDLSDKPVHHRVWSKGFNTQDKSNFELKLPDFLGCNSFVDSEIGRVVAAINEYASDALVIYTSDHGDMLGSHSLMGSGKGPAMYEEITNIPLIVRWPNQMPNNAVNVQCISHIDLVPTIMDAFELELPKWLDGRSLLPTFKNPLVAVNEAVFMEFGRYEIDHDGFGGFQPIRCIRDARYKLVINLLTTDELYDLENDPEEMTNLIQDAAYAETRNQLHDKLLNWMNETRDPFRGTYWQRRPWRTDAPPPDWEYTGMTRQREGEPFEPRQLDYATGLEIEQATRKK